MAFNNDNGRQTALVTGASSGIGFEVFRSLCNEGYKVCGVSRTKPQNIPDGGLWLPLDLNNKNSINECIEKAARELGDIDVLVNCAGVAIAGAIEETPISDAETLFQVNFFGTMAITKKVIEQMRPRKKGLVLTITSIASEIPLPFQAYYSASKAALENAMAALRMEVDKLGIVVSVLSPGNYRTGLTQNRKCIPYEHSKFGQGYRNALDTLAEDEVRGGDPEEIGSIAVRVVRQRKPKFRFVEGPRLERLFLALIPVIPRWVSHRILVHHYRI